MVGSGGMRGGIRERENGLKRKDGLKMEDDLKMG